MSSWMSLRALPSAVAQLLPSTTEPTICVHEGEIVACNQAWQALCGFESGEALGCSPKILHGELTDCRKALHFREELERFGRSATTLCNYAKNGRPFVHRIRGWRLGLGDSKNVSPYYLTQGCEVGDDALRHAIFKAARAHVSERESRAWMLIALVTAFGAFSSISIGLHGHSLTHELVMYGGMVLMWTLVPALNLLVPPNYSTPRTRRLKKPVVSDELFAVLTTALMGVALVLVSPSLLLLLTIPAATALLSWQLLALMEAADETCESEATCVTPSRAPALANMNLWRTPSPELVPPKQSNHEYDTDLMMLGSVLFATASGIGLVALAQQPDLGSFNTHEQQYNFFHLGMPGFAPHGSPLASRFIWPNIWLAHVYA